MLYGASTKTVSIERSRKLDDISNVANNLSTVDNDLVVKK